MPQRQLLQVALQKVTWKYNNKANKLLKKRPNRHTTRIKRIAKMVLMEQMVANEKCENCAVSVREQITCAV